MSCFLLPRRPRTASLVHSHMLKRHASQDMDPFSTALAQHPFRLGIRGGGWRKKLQRDEKVKAFQGAGSPLSTKE